jgi:hypothetical protein
LLQRGERHLEFTLFYKGELKGRTTATPEDKHRIRRVFHEQMAELWKLDPLAMNHDYVSYEKPLQDHFGVKRICFLEEFGRFTFAPLVTSRLFLAAKLRITLLRPETPGNIFHNRGDIDNQLKTLLDSLSMPKHLNQLPTEATPLSDETPFFCLLQDDSLVTSVSVDTDRLLLPATTPPDKSVVVTVHVKTVVTKPVMAALDFL